MWHWLLLSSKSSSLLIQSFWTAVQSVFTARWDVLLLRNTEYIERWYCYLLYLYFTWLNMQVIILVNILYCSFISLAPLVEKHWPKERSSIIAFASDLLAVVGLMDRALDLKSEVTQGCGFESRLRQEVHDCSPGAAQSAAHCSKCVHLDGLNAENTFHSSLYSV